MWGDLGDLGTAGNFQASTKHQGMCDLEVSILGAELSQAREQVPSKDFILTEKEADLANKKKELAVRAVVITQSRKSLLGNAESVLRPR